MTLLESIKEELQHLADSAIAVHSQKYFKTQEGEYGHGDIFLGIRVPLLRQKVKVYQTLPVSEAFVLLQSPYHEARLLALLILVRHFEKGDETRRWQIYEGYLNHTKFINNWDLVDSSAHKIVGAYLFGKDPSPLFKLAHSCDLWEKRIAVIATFYFIAKGRFDEALTLAELLLKDDHDLIHKAVGWMLREIGNKAFPIEDNFLRKHYRQMPRTMLRYAIEKFPQELRQQYLKGTL